jgi:carbonic anhydrase
MRFLKGALLLFVILGCSPKGEGESGEVAPAAQSGKQEPTGKPEEVHWGYEGENGPERWADLSSEFVTCRQGKRQSPIDLNGSKPVEGAAIERRIGREVLTFQQRAQVMDLVDNGHTIQVTNDVSMTLDIGSDHFELVQYHFHAPSEHTIDGVASPLEIHFVHKSASGDLAVVGILVEEGEHDPLWDPLIAALPSGPGDSRHVEHLDLDMNELRPLPRRYYRYQGSLTTPPCSEGVEWVVMAEYRRISSDQMAAVVSRLHDNNRPVQSLHERELFLISD